MFVDELKLVEVVVVAAVLVVSVVEAGLVVSVVLS
jgi:hypothetical protein